MSGTLIIVSAPSGAGKTTLLKKVMNGLERLAFSVSHTTRAPRQSEKDGREYHFIDRPRFQKMIDEQAFLEWAVVHGDYYGTALAPVQHQLAQGIDIVLDIDVQGAQIIREAAFVPSVSVFIAPPDRDELERRLRGRGTESEEKIRLRLMNGAEEMKQCEHYDYLIVNDRLDRAVRILSAIIIAERARGRRTETGSAIARDGW